MVQKHKGAKAQKVQWSKGTKEQRCKGAWHKSTKAQRLGKVLIDAVIWHYTKVWYFTMAWHFTMVLHSNNKTMTIEKF